MDLLPSFARHLIKSDNTNGVYSHPPNSQHPNENGHSLPTLFLFHRQWVCTSTTYIVENTSPRSCHHHLYHTPPPNPCHHKQEHPYPNSIRTPSSSLDPRNNNVEKEKRNKRSVSLATLFTKHIAW